MDVSVVITTFNRARSLAQTLEALGSQELSPNVFEVIVADNGSIDSTKDLCEHHRKNFTNFTYIYDQRPGQLVGWHRALNISRGEVCCFIDDDVCPERYWLSGVVDAFKDSQVCLATGPISLSYEKPPPEWVNYMKIGEPGAQTLPAFGMLDYGKELKPIPGNFVWGTNFVVRKSTLYEVNGFHPCAMPAHLLKFYGDGEIYVGRSIEKLGRKIIYHPSISVSHNIYKYRLDVKSLKSKFFTSGYVKSFVMLRKLGKKYKLPSDSDFYNIASEYFPNLSKTPKELVKIVQDSIGTGMRIHLTNFVKDRNFRKWVLQENYMDIEKVYVHPELIKSSNRKVSVDWRLGH